MAGGSSLLLFKEQFDRAASSIALNLAEGSGKYSTKDKKRFYTIAFGSLRECQSILLLAGLEDSKHWNQLDTVAAHLYRLIEASG